MCDERRKFYADRRERCCEWIRQFVEFDGNKDDSGRTKRQRNVDYGVPYLNPVEVDLEPAEEHILRLFWDIGKFRTSGMNGPNALSPDIIDGWQRLFKTPLTEIELKLLVELDVVYRGALYDEQQRQDKPKEARYEL